MPKPPENRLPEGLDHTHLRILNFVANGVFQKDFGDKIGLKRRAISERLQQIRTILNATTTPHAVFIAVEQGIIVPKGVKLIGLTPVQGKVVRKIVVEGKKPSETAKDLNLAQKTVVCYLNDIKRQNDLRTLEHLAAHSSKLLSMERRSKQKSFDELSKIEQRAIASSAAGQNYNEIATSLNKGAYATRRKIGSAFSTIGHTRRSLAVTLGIGKKLPPEGVHLTAAEWQTLHTIASGYVENSDIAKVTNFSKNSIDNALRSVRRKTGLSNNTEVVVNAEEILASSGISSEQASAFCKDLKKKNGLKR